MANTIIITKNGNGNVCLTNNGVESSFPPDYFLSNKGGKTQIKTKSMNLVSTLDPADVEKVIYSNGTEVFISTNAQLFQELKDNFFFSLTDGASAIRGKFGGFINFREEFVGDGVETQFQLDGTITNGLFTIGVWNADNLLVNQPKDIARTDNLKPVYNSSNIFTRTRVSVVSISATGLVTFNVPPQDTVDFNIYYWYDLELNDAVDNYVRDDAATSPEIDTPIASEVPLNLATNGLTQGNVQGGIDEIQESLLQHGFEYPNGVALLSVNGGDVTKFDLLGHIYWIGGNKYIFPGATNPSATLEIATEPPKSPIDKPVNNPVAPGKIYLFPPIQ